MRIDPRFPLVVGEESNLVLLASCLGDEDTGGGLFAYDGLNLERLDRLSSTGISVFDNQLVRLLRSSVDADSSGEVLFYDQRGVRRYWRVDALSDAHDILWDKSGIVAVSTGTNSILWLSPSGDVVRTWKAAGEADAWHLNSLVRHDGRLYAAAFGRFASHREWSETKDKAQGLVFEIDTGSSILTRLFCPHHPRFIDGGWLVSNSAKKELVKIDPQNGAIQRQLQLEGWTRGIAVTDRFVFIGESTNRRDTRPELHASIAVICRDSWAVLDRISVPCREIYDLALASTSLLAGVRRGFCTNAQRVAEQQQYALFQAAGIEPERLWATGDPLPPEACRVKIEAVMPETACSDTIIEVECSVENLGTSFLVSAPPNPIHISSKWLDPSTGSKVEMMEGMRRRLPQTLAPRQTLRAKVPVKTPTQPGTYLLRLTLVQEAVAWFDDLDASNACSQLVRISQG